MTQPLIAGPIAPLGHDPLIYALDALESTMQVPAADLSPDEIQKDKQYIRDHTQYTCSVLLSSQPDDVFIMDKVYQDQKHLIDWLRIVYKRVGVEIAADIRFAPPQEFAATAREILNSRTDIDTVSTICFSYLLDGVFPDPERFEASRRVNAKTSLSEIAKNYGLSIPRTAVCEVGELTQIFARDFEPKAKSVYIKLDGLGGGANVINASDMDDVAAIQQQYQANRNCIMQEAVPDEYLQTIHIYTVSDTAVSHQGSRSKMVADNQWYGNIFLPGLRLSASQQAAMDKAAEAIRDEGYTADKPLLLGMDAFMDGSEILITEINARWLGSSPTEYILRRVGIYGSVEAVALSDTIVEQDLEKFMGWTERHMYRPGLHGTAQDTSGFSVLPLGFSGYVDDGNRLVGSIIFGDFLAFQAEFKKSFSDASFPLLDHTADLYQDAMRKVAIFNNENS